MKRFAIPLMCLMSVCLSAVVAAEPPAGSAAPASTAPADPVVTVIDAGAGDKKPLRYTFVKGAEAAFETSMSMTTTTSMGGQAMPSQAIPVIKMTVGGKILDVNADGDATYEFSYTAVDVTDDPKNPSMMAGAMRNSMRALVGLGGSMVLSPRGVAKSFDVKIPANADPMVKQQLESMKENFSQYCLPLPEEPVGVGATWTVQQNIRQQGMTIQQTTTSKLKGIEGDALDVEMELTQHADEQDVQHPQAPGMKLHLKSLAGKGTGVSRNSLSSPLPVMWDMKMDHVTVMELPQVGEMKTDMKMTMTGRRAADAPQAKP